MSLIERLDGWRDPDIYDDPPSEEEVLRQFLYAAITDFIEQRWDTLHDILEGEEEPDDLDSLANKWVDEYAAAASALTNRTV